MRCLLLSVLLGKTSIKYWTALIKRFRMIYATVYKQSQWKTSLQIITGMCRMGEKVNKEYSVYRTKQLVHAPNCCRTIFMMRCISSSFWAIKIPPPEVVITLFPLKEYIPYILLLLSMHGRRCQQNFFHNTAASTSKDIYFNMLYTHSNKVTARIILIKR